MATIAIIGATGEVGFRLVEALHTAHEIVAVVRNREKRDFGPYPGVVIRQVDDIADIDRLAPALDGCEAVINASYIWFAEQIHHAISRNRTPVRHIVFTGSTGIHTRLPSHSADRKRAAEQYIREHFTCHWTIIRPTMIYGHKDDRNISKLLRVVARVPVMPLIGSGGSLIQPVMIHDLVRAYDIALLNPTYFDKTYDIGGSKAYSNRALMACAMSSVGRRARFVSLPTPLVRRGAAILSTMGLKFISQEQIGRFAEDKDIDLSSFVRDFGYLPRNFEEGVHHLVSEMKRCGQIR